MAQISLRDVIPKVLLNGSQNLAPDTEDVTYFFYVCSSVFNNIILRVMNGESKLLFNCTTSCASINYLGITWGANVREFRKKREIAFILIGFYMKGIPGLF